MREQPNYLVTFLDQRDAIKKEGEDDEQQQTEKKSTEEEDEESPFLIKQKSYPCVYLII